MPARGGTKRHWLMGDSGSLRSAGAAKFSVRRVGGVAASSALKNASPRSAPRHAGRAQKLLQ